MALASWEWAVLGTTAAATAVAWIAARRARASAARTVTEAAGAAGERLAAGERWVAGTLELLEGELPEIVVFERGRDEVTAGEKPRSFWHETKRETRSRPFTLVTAAEERIHVAPPPSPSIRAPLHVVARPSLHERVRGTRLEPGAHALVRGVLVTPPDSGYRGAPEPWRLVPTSSGAMSIVAGELDALGAPAERRARLYARLAVELGGALVVIALVLAAGSPHSPGPWLGSFVWIAGAYAVLAIHRRGRTLEWYEGGRLRSVEPGRLSDSMSTERVASPAPVDPTAQALKSASDTALQPALPIAEPIAEDLRTKEELAALCARMRRVDHTVPSGRGGPLLDGGEHQEIVHVLSSGYHVWHNGRDGGRSIRRFATRDALLFDAVASFARAAAQREATARGATGADHVRLAQARTRELLEAARPGWSTRLGQPRDVD